MIYDDSPEEVRLKFKTELKILFRGHYVFINSSRSDSDSCSVSEGETVQDKTVRL